MFRQRAEIEVCGLAHKWYPITLDNFVGANLHAEPTGHWHQNTFRSLWCFLVAARLGFGSDLALILESGAQPSLVVFETGQFRVRCDSKQLLTRGRDLKAARRPSYCTYHHRSVLQD